MQETEYKFLVDKKKFYEILELVKSFYPESQAKEKVQINYYYDTDDEYLLSRHTTLRIRQTEDDLKLELKESQLLTGDDFSTCTETSRKIDSLKSDITLESGKFAWIPFTLQGNLVTRRYSIKPCESLSIDFDVNYYLGKCDYEIEMEFTESGKKGTKLLVEKLELLEYKNKTGGKARRFFLAKSEIKL